MDRKASTSLGETEDVYEGTDGSRMPDVDGPDESNKFDKAISAWRNINLAHLIPSLDTTASDLVSHQRDALVERKELAQKTKEFRKLDDSDKLLEIKSLLKSYQSYIDLVSNHSKTISSAFLQIYSTLSEAPDPYPLLEASVDSLVLADTTVPTLEAENKHLQNSNERLTQQLSETERRLETEQAARKASAETEVTRSQEVEASWSAVLKEKQDNWIAKERSLEERAENQERLLKELKANAEVSQRLRQESESEHFTGYLDTTTAELEVVNADLDRAQARIADIEAHNEQLRIDLARSRASRGEDHPQVEENPAYLRIRSENSSLLRKIESSRLERDAWKREREAETKKLHREVTNARDDNELLRKKIQKWSDYEDIKQELEVLKSIELATDLNEDPENNGEVSEPDGATRREQKDGPQNLERLLMTRNAKLNNELTLLRVSHQDLVTRLDGLQDELSNSNMELDKSQAVTLALENDISRMEHELSNLHAPASVTGNYSSRLATLSRKGRVSPTSSIISGFDQPQTPSSATESYGAVPSGILPMVTAQRDRFRKRNSELEAELNSTHQTVTSLRAEISSLQKDNLNLYEKTRYVSSYGRSQPATSSSSSYSTNPNPSSVRIGEDNQLDRYRSQYESKISPFAAFRGRESVRAFKRMTFPERAILQVTRLVLATRTSRNLFAIYCLGLHILVLGILFYASTIEVEKHTSNLADDKISTVGLPKGDTTWQQDSFHVAG